MDQQYQYTGTSAEVSRHRNKRSVEGMYEDGPNVFSLDPQDDPCATNNLIDLSNTRDRTEARNHLLRDIKCNPTPKRQNIAHERSNFTDSMEAPTVTPLRTGVESTGSSSGHLDGSFANFNPTNNYGYQPAYDTFARNLPGESLDRHIPFVTPARYHYDNALSCNPFSDGFNDLGSSRSVFASETWLADPSKMDEAGFPTPLGARRSSFTDLFDNQGASSLPEFSLSPPRKASDFSGGKYFPQPNSAPPLETPANYSSNHCDPALQYTTCSSSGSSQASQIGSRTNNEPSENTPEESDKRFKPFHAKKWNEHIIKLRAFKAKYGHCLVPHTFSEDPHLARWVKRQRRQYKLMIEDSNKSTMTPSRVKLLNAEGFIWDSHDVVWKERYEQLLHYKQCHGHCRVPTYSKEIPQLASWVKCQRRQYKLFCGGKRSSMSIARLQALENIGFTWEIRPEVAARKRTVPNKIADEIK